MNTTWHKDRFPTQAPRGKAQYRRVASTAMAALILLAAFLPSLFPACTAPSRSDTPGQNRPVLSRVLSVPPALPGTSSAGFTVLTDPAMPRTLAAVESLDPPPSISIVRPGEALSWQRGNLLVFYTRATEKTVRGAEQISVSSNPDAISVPADPNAKIETPPAVKGSGIFEVLSDAAGPGNGLQPAENDRTAVEGDRTAVEGDSVATEIEEILGPGARFAGNLFVTRRGRVPMAIAAMAAELPSEPCGTRARTIVFTPAAENLPGKTLVEAVRTAAAFLSPPEWVATRHDTALAAESNETGPAVSEGLNPAKRLAAIAKAIAVAGDPVTPVEIAEWARLAAEQDREAQALLKEVLASIHGKDPAFLEGVLDTLREEGGRILVREGAPLDTSRLADLEIRPLGDPGAIAIADILARAAKGGVEIADAPAEARRTAEKQAAEKQAAEKRAAESGASGTNEGTTRVTTSSGDERAEFAEGGSGVGLAGLTDWIDPYPKVRNGAIAGSIRLASGAAPADQIRVQATGDGVARYARSGEDGDFFIPEVPIGVYDVTYMAPGYTPAITGEALYRKAWVGNGETYVMPDMVLKAAPSAIPGNSGGKVVNMVSGDLMAGVAVAVRNHYVLSGHDGSFTVAGLAPGPATIRAMASGYRTYEASLVIVPGQEVSHTVIMEPVEAGANGIIGTDEWGHLIDWSSVVVMVRGVPHETIKVENGVFSVKVPALMPEYTVEIRAPYCEPSVVTVAGPLYPGGTLGVPGLILRRRTASVAFRLFTGTACEGSVYVVVSGMGTFGPSSDFGGGFESRVGPVTLPQGPTKFSTMGAGGLRPSHRDSEKFEMTISGYTGEISLYLPR